jgi:hypothetical protein
MSDPGHFPPAGREFVFRTIQRLMVVDIIGGGALVLLGLFVLDLPALAIAGAFLACMGVGLVFLFGALARRTAGGARTARGTPHELRR